MLERLPQLCHKGTSSVYFYGPLHPDDDKRLFAFQLLMCSLLEKAGTLFPDLF